MSNKTKYIWLFMSLCVCVCERDREGQRERVCPLAVGRVSRTSKTAGWPRGRDEDP